jgi:hypothetical protein
MVGERRARERSHLHSARKAFARFAEEPKFWKD